MSGTRRPLYAKESQKIKLRMKTSDEEERKNEIYRK